MNYKQKLGYTILGAGVMAIGVIMGQLIISDIEAQNNGVFNKITCRELVVVDKNGDEVIILESQESGNIVKVYDKTKERSITLDGIQFSKQRRIASGIIPPEPRQEVPFKSKRNEMNPDRVAKNPSFSDYMQAFEDHNVDLMNELKQRSTELREGLEFPRDTFAVDRKRDIVVGHGADGNGFVINRGQMIMVGRNIRLGWLAYEKRSDLRVLTHYDPK